MTKSHTLNRTLTEKKLRSALQLSFPKEPETEQGIIDFLNTYMDDFASKLSEQQDEASVRTKTALREDLRKELSSKEDVLISETRLQAWINRVETSLRAQISRAETSLRAEIQQVKTELQAEISRVETNLRAEIRQIRVEIRFYVLLIVLAMVVLNPGTLQALRELLPFIR